MRSLFIATMLCFFSVVGHGSLDSKTSLEAIKDLPPFDPVVQKHVFLKVLEKMNLTENSGIPMPKIRVSEGIFPYEADIINASESQGMPGWAFEKGINIFLIDLNTIVLGRDMKVHNLAHEYVHYVQMHYKNYERSEFAMDYVEEEAVNIQNYFR